MKRIAFLFLFSFSFLAFTSFTFSDFSGVAFADDKKVIKKKIRKKISIKKADGKITIKKKVDIKKSIKKKRNGDKDKDDDKGGRGIPKQIRKLNAKVNALQQQVDTIELTPGPPGPPGTPGVDGVDGQDGAKGEKGDTGDQGIQGEQGPKGDTGDQGIQGEQGPKGDTGDQGIQGEKGDKGDTGAIGATGATGAKGDKGDIGPAGPSGGEIAGRLDPCIPSGGLGMVAHIPGRSFSVYLPFDGSFIFSHVPAGTHSIVFVLNGNVIGMLPNITVVDGQTTDVGVFVTAFCQGDQDGDGVTGVQGDCDNNNASVFPGAPEVCDGVDNNCDTVIDEGGVCDHAACTTQETQSLQSCFTACDSASDPLTCQSTCLAQVSSSCANGAQLLGLCAVQSGCPVNLSSDILSLCVFQNCSTQWQDTFGDFDPGCGTGQTQCGGQCVDLNSDVNNCGGCNVACGAGESCSNGVCEADNSCIPGTACDADGNGCTQDVCNSAGTCVVGPTASCDDGNACTQDSCTSIGVNTFQCSFQASGSGTSCSGQCVDTNSDPNNCGGCNVACGAGESCSNGACVVAAICGDGIVDFSVESCDTAGDSASCDSDCTAVACGDGHANSAAGETCDTAGDSVSCDSDCTAVACGDGHVNPAAGELCDAAGDSVSCDSDCTAVACGDGHLNLAAGETCDDGNNIDGDGCSSICQHACPVDQLGQPTFCSGACVHLAIDSNNCGACGVSCAAGQICANGGCFNLPSFP